MWMWVVAAIFARSLTHLHIPHDDRAQVPVANRRVPKRGHPGIHPGKVNLVSVQVLALSLDGNLRRSKRGVQTN